MVAGNGCGPGSFPWAMPPVDPPGTDPADRDPDQRDLQRRSATPALAPWLLISAVLILGAAAFVAFAYLA